MNITSLRFGRRAVVGIVALAMFAWAPSRATAAEELKSRQATIKGLVVRTIDGGKLSGMAIGIVATASNDTAGGRVSIRGTIGKQMKSALDEAERYVRLKHRNLGNADIELSFEERYSPKDGGSAGTAFAVLLRSLAEGFEIDPLVSITGDIAVNGTVQQIGGTSAKLKGARSDGSTISIIPKPNVTAVGDLLVAAEKIDVLASQQIFYAETVDDAIAVSRKDRPQKVVDAMRIYAEVQQALQARRLTALRDPAVVVKLKNVMDLAPNHVSAKFAYDIAINKGPATLTRMASLVEVFSAADPFFEAFAAEGDVTRDRLPIATVRAMQKEMLTLRRLIHPDVEPLRVSLVDWIDAVDRILSAKKPITRADKEIIEKRRQALVAALKRLDTDEAMISAMRREGY